MESARVQATLSGDVLVLNRNFRPIHVTSVRRAFVQLYEGVARAVDREWRTFDFESWSALGEAMRGEQDSIATVRRRYRVPRVIQLVGYGFVPSTKVRFSRANVYARDGSRCQYCGHRFARQALNLDHVVPRSKGGLTTWENVVCSCIRCNLRKGGRTPEEAGMRLLKVPAVPRWSPVFRAPVRLHDDWRPFLTVADMAYWNVELDVDPRR